MITVIIPALNEKEINRGAIDPLISSVPVTVNYNAMDHKNVCFTEKICRDTVAEHVIKEPAFALLKPILN